MAQGVPPSVVGRDRELAVIEDAFGTACEGEVRFLMLLGEPGSGKSRLVEEVAERHAELAQCLRVRCDAVTASEPLGPWRAALREADRGGAEGPNELVAAIGALAARVPVVITIDDMHRSDASSWALLDRLSGLCTAAGVLVVLTATSGRLADRPVELRVIADLERRGFLARVPLGPLSEEAVLELARARRHGGVTLALARRLADRSGGNAFYAVALLDELGMQEGEDLAVALPAAVRADVQARVAEAGRGAGDVLESLAAAGGRLELAILPDVAGAPVERLAPVLRRLVDVRLVEEERDQGHEAYVIPHPMVLDAIGRDVGAARRLAVAREVGRAHLHAGRHGEAARVFSASIHVADDVSIELLIDALRRLDGRGGYADGIALLGALGATMPRGAADWVEVAGSMHNWMGDHRVDGDRDGAVEALRKIDALPEGSLDDRRRATVNACMVTLLAYGSGRLRQAAKAARRAIRLFERGGSEADVLLARLELAYVGALGGEDPSWTEEVEEIVDRAEALADPGVLEAALGARGLARLLDGQLTEAEVSFRRAIELAWDLDKTGSVVQHSQRLGWTLAYDGRPEKALDALESAKAADPEWIESSVPELRAYVCWLSGDLGAARALETEFQGRQPTLRRGVGWSVAALASAEAGELGAARAALARVDRTYSRGDWFIATDLYRHARGVLAWREGEPEAAAAALRLASTHLVAIGARAVAAPVLLDRVELELQRGGSGAAPAAELKAIAVASDSALFAGMSRLAEAWVQLSQRRPEPAREAAVAASRQLGGYRVLRGRALVALARARSWLGEPEAVSSLREAARAFNLAGAVWRRDEALDELRGLGESGRNAATTALGFDSLTGREWEVIELAAQRLSAQQIADRLILSRRTIESHLASVYRKLEVHSRADLLNKLASQPQDRLKQTNRW